ncbi:MAG: type II 3-dehydroquinate dehydratase [Acidaminococcales bacterium]|jgi:3-dehydroquinate dehydratase-2|nr:type II 3-dehydroquinate dehydratase [Acidaminococcales bacterium]
MNKKVLVLHGPNLNLLGIREPEYYGSVSLHEINRLLREKAAEYGLEIECFQSNGECALVEKIQSAYKTVDCIIINAAAFTHYSVAIRDALKAVNVPAIEVHLSNIDAREEFRRHSVIADIVAGRITGFGKNSYLLALAAAKEMMGNNEQTFGKSG